jgi:hypothetical protein
MKKKVFISYSGNDRNKMQSLLKRVKKIKTLTPIVVEYNKNPMKFLSEKVRKQLIKSDIVIPILTNKSINTQYINQEIGFAFAKTKRIIPIVEHEIISNLRGFITSQNDLPYQFNKSDNAQRENKAFLSCCDALLSDIDAELKKKKEFGLSNIFRGKWINEFQFQNGEKGKERFQIKNNNQYFIDDKLMFRLDKIFISKDRETIRFTKNGVNDGDSRILQNLIKLESPGIYSGDEIGNKVKYTHAK